MPFIGFSQLFFGTSDYLVHSDSSAKQNFASLISFVRNIHTATKSKRKSEFVTHALQLTAIEFWLSFWPECALLSSWSFSCWLSVAMSDRWCRGERRKRNRRMVVAGPAAMQLRTPVFWMHRATRPLSRPRHLRHRQTCSLRRAHRRAATQTVVSTTSST